jgi:hypothetical protein
MPEDSFDARRGMLTPDLIEEKRGGGLAGTGEQAMTAPSTPKAKPLPGNRRELAQAIFAQCDPVALGRRLLESAEDRGASTQLRALEMFTEWAYGSSDSDEESGPTRVIWDLPRHRNEGGNADTARSEGGEK